MNTAILIIARWGASRKPGKMLADIGGHPLLERLIERLKQAKQPEKLILATTCLPEDNQLSAVARSNNLLVYRGSVDDVIERMLGACQTYAVDFAIIAEGDELFCDPLYVDRALELALRTGVDCVKTRNLPIGSWVVGIRRNALEEVYSSKGNASTDGWSRFFTEDPRFQTEWLDPDPELPSFDPNLRLTIDYEEDLVLARELYQRLERPGKIISLRAVLELMQQEPELIKINSFLNEAYWGRLHSSITHTTSENLK
jgi:spore coat polysaccharide biosynthesis protein SpsF